MTNIEAAVGSAPPVDELPPLDSRALTFDIARETRRTLVDIMRGEEPTTILGVVLANPDKGATIEAIAKHLDEPVSLVRWNVEKLEKDGLCVRVSMQGVTRVLPLAAYTQRNA
jgi:hypothetical protein